MQLQRSAKKYNLLRTRSSAHVSPTNQYVYSASQNLKKNQLRRLVSNVKLHTRPNILQVDGPRRDSCLHVTENDQQMTFGTILRPVCLRRKKRLRYV